MWAATAIDMANLATLRCHICQKSNVTFCLRRVEESVLEIFENLIKSRVTLLPSLICNVSVSLSETDFHVGSLHDRNLSFKIYDCVLILNLTIWNMSNDNSSSLNLRVFRIQKKPVLTHKSLSNGSYGRSTMLSSERHLKKRVLQLQILDIPVSTMERQIPT